MRIFAAAALAASAALAGAQTFQGPSPYLQFSDSPWSGLAFDYFHLEDLEDNLFNTPGATLAQGVVTSASFGKSTINDSVDGDDGVINGLGYANGYIGDSVFSSNRLRINFDANVLGALPTHAGIVWTDGNGPTIFEAFDKDGLSLGTLNGNHSDGQIGSQTAEDRFYGVEHLGGISAIELWNTTSAIEADHIAAQSRPRSVKLSRWLWTLNARRRRDAGRHRLQRVRKSRDRPA